MCLRVGGSCAVQRRAPHYSDHAACAAFDYHISQPHCHVDERLQQRRPEGVQPPGAGLCTLLSFCGSNTPASSLSGVSNECTILLGTRCGKRAATCEALSDASRSSVAHAPCSSAAPTSSPSVTPAVAAAGSPASCTTRTTSTSSSSTLGGANSNHQTQPRLER